ncbi:MAG TPA: hypothetical protein VGG57_06695 [Stellaceae bacterium]|jgi:hypothetical protein
MRSTFFALSVAALTIFATAAHADDGPMSRSAVAPSQATHSLDHLLVALGTPNLIRHSSVVPATVSGSGTVGTACHATNQSGDQLNDGTYSSTDLTGSGGGLWCCGPGSTKTSCYNCNNSTVTCTDGKF